MTHLKRQIGSLERKMDEDLRKAKKLRREAEQLRRDYHALNVKATRYRKAEANEARLKA